MALGYRAALVVAAAALVAVALPAPAVPAFLALDAVIVGLMATDLALAPRPDRLLGGRDAPGALSVGHEAGIRLSLRGTGRAVRVAARDPLPASLRPEPARIRAAIPPEGGEIGYTIRPERRGRFTLPRTTIRSFGPMGLAARQGAAGHTAELRVYPDLHARGQVETRLRRQRLLEQGTRSATVRGGGREFDFLREYHPDDEFRRISWRATARAGKPISAVYREERNQHLIMLFDAGRAMAATVGSAPRFEHALDAGIALATLAERVGDRVGAFAFADRSLGGAPPRSDRAQVARLVETLFDVEPTPVAADYEGAIGRVLSRFRRRAMVVLFTDLADEAASETLLRVMPALLRHHLVLVVEVRDPELDRLARTRPPTDREAYAKAAATGMIARRDGAAARLRRLGAGVVDRLPGEVVGAVLDEYLTAKAYGRL